MLPPAHVVYQDTQIGILTTWNKRLLTAKPVDRVDPGEQAEARPPPRTRTCPRVARPDKAPEPPGTPAAV